MAGKSVPSRRKAKEITSRLPSTKRVQHLAMLAPPLLFGREEANAYDELFGRLCATIKPADVLEEIFVADIASLQWEIMELRRIKKNLTKGIAFSSLKSFLGDTLNLGSLLEEDIDRGMVEQLTGETRTRAEKLLEQDDGDSILALHDIIGEKREAAEKRVRALLAPRVARSFLQEEPNGLKQVSQALSESGESVREVIDARLIHRMPEIERVNRLIAGAEALRNASLREIERRRARLGEALRRTLEAEDAAVQMVEQVSPIEKTADEQRSQDQG